MSSPRLAAVLGYEQISRLLFSLLGFCCCGVVLVLGGGLVLGAVFVLAQVAVVCVFAGAGRFCVPTLFGAEGW